MRLVLQRVKKAAVKVQGETVGEIGRGFLILLGAARGDTDEKALQLADRCAVLRVFEDDDGKMNLNVKEVGGQVLVVSQFTLCADLAKGRRPSFDGAMAPEAANTLYEKFCDFLTIRGITVRKGLFGAKMAVELINDGPVTFILEN